MLGDHAAERIEHDAVTAVLGLTHTQRDLAVLDGSRSTFACSLPDAELERRCTDFDIHPTGPLPGRGGSRAERAAADIESRVLQPFAAVIAALQRAGVNADRRSLRVRPAGLSWQFDGADLLLAFTLPPGAYATAMLRELVSADADSISRDI